VTNPTELVERLLAGNASPAESRGAVRALLRHLPPAAAAADAPPLPDAALYDAAVERAAAAARRVEQQLAGEEARLPSRLAELERLVPAQGSDDGDLVRVEQRLAQDARYHSWALCRELSRLSLEATFDDPWRAVVLARMAVAIAGALTAGPESDALRNDLRALCWGHLGNAQRVASDLRAAERALATAQELLARGTGDPLVRCQLLGFEISLRSDQSRFDEALALCRRAVHLARRLGDAHLEGRLLSQQATLYAYRGDAHRSIASLERGVALIDVEAEPRLALVARHNLISYLSEGGRHREAWERLPETRALAEQLGHPLDRVRLRWLEGRIALRLGRVEEGLAALHEARDAFLAKEIGYAAALISLELAVFHAERGERAQVRRLAEEMLPLFAARDVHREAQAALKLFCDAARAERAELDLARAVLDYLERARRHPDLRFRP